MSTAEESVTIAASPERVLEVLRDPDEATRWFPLAVELVDPPEEPVEKGDEMVSRGELAGQHVEWKVTVDDVRENGVTLTASGPITCIVRSSLEGADDATELTVALDIGSGGITGKLMEGAAKPLAAPSLRHALECIRERVEG